MDAQTTAAAALALVVDNSRDDVVCELLLERERLAMALADRDSFLAQRHFVVSAQVELPWRLLTWQQCWRRQHLDYHDLLDTIRAAIRAICSGNFTAALDRLRFEVQNDEASEIEETDVEM